MLEALVYQLIAVFLLLYFTSCFQHIDFYIVPFKCLGTQGKTMVKRCQLWQKE